MTHDNREPDVNLADVGKPLENAEKPGGQIDKLEQELHLKGAPPEREPEEPEKGQATGEHDKQERDIDLAGRTPEVIADIKRMGGIETYRASKAQVPTPDPTPGRTRPADPD